MIFRDTLFTLRPWVLGFLPEIHSPEESLTMNEWEFTAEIASLINIYLGADPSLPLSRAACEQSGKGSRKRRDLTLLDKGGKIALTGEIKLPFRPDGGTPFNTTLVESARSKALRAGSAYFFTWNVNEFVLWETRGERVSWQEENYRSWEITSVLQESHLESPPTLHAIDSWLFKFLREFSGILRKSLDIGTKLPDEKFIDALESALRMPVCLTQEELEKRYTNRFKAELDQWMRNEQGWTITDDPDGIRENLGNAAKAACYALVNKLVFHDALLKQYKGKMDQLGVPAHCDTGEQLRDHLEHFFAEAKTVTCDYETVFGEDPTSIGNRIPFYSNLAAPHWCELIAQINRFDFSQLDYEVIGSIFERLVEPDRRRRFGQFYTRVEVVDLINSFCIRTGAEKVLDPACGGGTFLVRAYARKRELLHQRHHVEILDDLYGVDVADFPARLTTINLAVRDLSNKENYPLIARQDFFNVRPRHPFLLLPRKIKTHGLGSADQRKIEIPELDAVVGNPPYIRQEGIRKGERAANGTPAPGTKEYYRKLAREESGVELSGRSDIHCYFWPHAAAFLKDEGYLCFLTSSQWLDVEYGFRLQEWILGNFEIVAVFESMEEPWFVGARVATAITILRRQKDERLRMENTVRFVQIRRPIADIMAHDGTVAGAVRSADEFRDEILNLRADESNNRFRARLVRQGDLWNEGVRLGTTISRVQNRQDGETEDEEGEEEHAGPPGTRGAPYAGKWGVYLRAPDLWFRLIDEFKDRFVPLGEIADIRRGITSGKDEFFFPKDCSADCLEKYKDRFDFEDLFGVPRKDVSSGRVKLVLCGAGRGETRPIEAEYLEPEVHSLMEIKGFTVSPEDCSRMILLVGKKKKELKGTYVLEYIKWGEKKNVHEGSTCRSRANAEREWYDLTGHERGALFWPMAQQYKHAIPLNPQNLICNHNLFDLTPLDTTPEVLAAVLNSTLTVLSKHQYGRPVGVEGNLKTEVIDVKMMLVPNPAGCSRKAAARLSESFRKMQQRPALQFLSERRMREMAWTQAGRAKELKDLPELCELGMADRWELDNAVLEMIGVTPKKRRQEILQNLYGYLRDFFEWTREKEEQAIANKRIARRRGSLSAADLAVQIHEDIVKNEPRLLWSYGRHFFDREKLYDTFDLPGEGVAEAHSDIFTPHGVLFRKRKKEEGTFVKTRFPFQDDLVVLVANSGIRSFVRFPHEEQECRRVFLEYERFLRQRDKRLRELIEERTADEEMQAKIFDALITLVNRE